MEGTNGDENSNIEARNWLEKMMSKRETREKISFLAKLDEPDFLFYAQIVEDLHRHGKDRGGNIGMDNYVDRKNCELSNTIDQLRGLIEEKERQISSSNEEKIHLEEELRAGKEVLRSERADMQSKLYEAGMSHLKDKVGSMEGSMRESDEKISQILATLEAQKKQSTPAAIGQRGVEWVVETLKKAFPPQAGPFKVFQTGQTQCGDAVLQLSGDCRIMVEVKYYMKGNVKSQNKGNEVKKFFEDAQQTKLGYR